MAQVVAASPAERAGLRGGSRADGGIIASADLRPARSTQDIGGYIGGNPQATP